MCYFCFVNIAEKKRKFLSPLNFCKPTSLRGKFSKIVFLFSLMDQEFVKSSSFLSMTS